MLGIIVRALLLVLEQVGYCGRWNASEDEKERRGEERMQGP